MSHYAVIFSSQRNTVDPEGYAATAAEMERLARLQPGFVGVESARGPDGFGITVSYWESESAIAAWGRQAEHLLAQRQGKGKWYASYSLRVAKLERETYFAADGES